MKKKSYLAMIAALTLSMFLALFTGCSSSKKYIPTSVTMDNGFTAQYYSSVRGDSYMITPENGEPYDMLSIVSAGDNYADECWIIENSAGEFSGTISLNPMSTDTSDGTYGYGIPADMANDDSFGGGNKLPTKVTVMITLLSSKCNFSELSVTLNNTVTGDASYSTDDGGTKWGNTIAFRNFTLSLTDFDPQTTESFEIAVKGLQAKAE